MSSAVPQRPAPPVDIDKAKDLEVVALRNQLRRSRADLLELSRALEDMLQEPKEMKAPSRSKEAVPFPEEADVDLKKRLLEQLKVGPSSDDDWSSYRTPLPEAGPARTIQVQGLLKAPPAVVPDPEVVARKSPRSPLLDELEMNIRLRGVITVGEYMHWCLSHPVHGYYQRRKHLFGRDGDFVTSPDISSMFGELLAVWVVSTWQRMGAPTQLQLVELGPGTGRLMRDMLRALRHFPQCYSAVSIHLVETSVPLRESQRDKLGVTLDDNGSPRHQQNNMFGPEVAEPSVDDVTEIPVMGREVVSGQTAEGKKVHWHWELPMVPNEVPSLIISNEFFDALPIHQFMYTDEGWREVMVDLDEGPGPHHLRLTLSRTPTPFSLGFEAEYPGLYPGMQPRPGQTIEFCPAAVKITHEIAKRIDQHGGAALLIDYGDFKPQELSLQGIRKHQHESVLREPGEVDLTALVDFHRIAASLASAPVRNAGSVRALPLVTQAAFLRELGIQARLDTVLSQTQTEAEQERIFKAAQRLVDPDGMGMHFKVLCLATRDLGVLAGFYEPPPSHPAYVSFVDATRLPKPFDVLSVPEPMQSNHHASEMIDVKSD